MLFSDRSIILILAKKKTQTTRLVEPRVKVGKVYSIRKHGLRKSYGSIRIISKKKLVLEVFTKADMKREGYDNLKKFIKALERRNSTKISLQRPIWKIIFKYLPR